jgi:signal transduction histidine kinase
VLKGDPVRTGIVPGWARAYADLGELDDAWRCIGAIARTLVDIACDILQWRGRAEDFALAPLIDGVVKTIEPLAAKNENRVAVNCDGAIGSLHADQMRLRQALLNLMSNTNKFTERGTISVDVRQGPEKGRD